MVIYIERETAMKIATRFLKQHFSIVHMDAVLEGGMWHVAAQIELFGDVMLENITIDAMTGQFHAQMLGMAPRSSALLSVPN